MFNLFTTDPSMKTGNVTSIIRPHLICIKYCGFLLSEWDYSRSSSFRILLQRVYRATRKASFKAGTKSITNVLLVASDEVICPPNTNISIYLKEVFSKVRIFVGPRQITNLCKNARFNFLFEGSKEERPEILLERNKKAVNYWVIRHVTSLLFSLFFCWPNEWRLAFSRS